MRAVRVLGQVAVDGPADPAQSHGEAGGLAQVAVVPLGVGTEVRREVGLEVLGALLVVDAPRDDALEGDGEGEEGVGDAGIPPVEDLVGAGAEEDLPVVEVVVLDGLPDPEGGELPAQVLDPLGARQAGIGVLEAGEQLGRTPQEACAAGDPGARARAGRRRRPRKPAGPGRRPRARRASAPGSAPGGSCRAAADRRPRAASSRCRSRGPAAGAPVRRTGTRPARGRPLRGSSPPRWP